MAIKRSVIRIVIDFVSLSIVALPILILNLVGQPFHRGFFCNDESLMHPYKSNTVPSWLAAVGAIFIPAILIFITEFYRHRCPWGIVHSRSNKKFYFGLYRTVLSFFFGLAATQLCTDLAKYSIGRLRPHFLSLCKPNLNCTQLPQYIEEDVCTSTDKSALREARLSFPSGHASIMMYSMIFVVIYQQRRLLWRKFWLVKPFVQLFMFLLAYYTAISRISDYMHHWSDVLAGSVLGIIVAFITIFFTTDIMSDITCCQSAGARTYDAELPFYSSTRQDDDRLSVKTNESSHTINSEDQSPRSVT